MDRAERANSLPQQMRAAPTAVVWPAPPQKEVVPTSD
jgi:hypothetical protein